MNFFKHLEGFFSKKFGITKDIYTLFKLEAKLAGLNVYPLLVSLSFLIAFVITLWLTVMLLVGELVYILTQQPILAILLIVLINMIAMLLLAKSLKYRLQKMCFARTRDCLRTRQEGIENESAEEKTISNPLTQTTTSESEKL